ncbi:MAG: hypothetical protein ACYTBX_06710 [Planctomycetota bacterium]
MDCRILKALQNDFPLSERPDEIIGRRLQIPCDEFWNKLLKLIAERLIRRIGASLYYGKFGFLQYINCCQSRASFS